MMIKERLQSHGWAIKNSAVIPPDMIMSDAFHSLISNTKSILIRFIQKRPYRKEGRGKTSRIVYDNNKLIFTYREARCFNISEASYKRSFRELVEKGFLSIEHQGGRVGSGRDWNKYKLIDDYKDWGTLNFKPRTKDPVIDISGGLAAYNKNRKANSPQSSMTRSTSSEMSWEAAKSSSRGGQK